MEEDKYLSYVISVSGPGYVLVYKGLVGVDIEKGDWLTEAQAIDLAVDHVRNAFCLPDEPDSVGLLSWSIDTI